MITRLSIALVLAALLALPAEAAVDPSAEAAALTSLLAEYLAADGQTDLAASLRSLDPSSTESRALLESAVGPKIFDFGARMFGWFEQQAASSQRGVETRPWATFESEHFLFAYRPGSVAGRDRALIASAAEDTWATVGSSFGLATAVEENGTLIANRTPDGSDHATTAKIVVTLHPFRSDDTAKRLKGPSLGTTSLGATIDDTGHGRLTTSIDVLYFNAFSLLVLHHEVAHAVMLLGTFDSGLLRAGPLQGESELRKAFLGGYRKLPAFLHEGIGDWALYNRGVYRRWGLLPPAEQLITGLQKSGEYVAIAKLADEDRRYRYAHHKVYSLEAASFLDWLLATEGKERVHAWLMSGDEKGSRAYARTFGKPLAQSEKAWLESLGK